MDNQTPRPTFLRLPIELRLQIYEHLLHIPLHVDAARRRLLSMPEHHDFQHHKANDLRYVVSIRNMQPSNYRVAKQWMCKWRSSYWIQNHGTATKQLETSYTCVSPLGIEPSIMSVNCQVHDEAARVLYGGYTFDFDTNIEASVAFLRDLTPVARSYIHHIGIARRAAHRENDLDRLSWSNMCSYMAESVPNLRELSLGIVVLKPYNGLIKPLDPRVVHALRKPHMMEWIRSLAAIRGLTTLHVRSCVEHCPPPDSTALEFFIAFSAFLEYGLAELLASSKNNLDAHSLVQLQSLAITNA